MRDGTRKSRAPSGLDAVRIGVWNSKKPGPPCGGRSELMIWPRFMMFLWMRSRSEVEEAVAQPDVLGYSCRRTRERQLGRLREDLDLGGEDLDKPVGSSRCFSVPGGAAHLAVDADHPLRAHLHGGLEGGRIRSATTWVMP